MLAADPGPLVRRHRQFGELRGLLHGPKSHASATLAREVAGKIALDCRTTVEAVLSEAR